MTIQQSFNSAKHFFAGRPAISSAKRFGWLRRMLGYMLAMVALPVLVGGITAAVNLNQIRVSQPPAFTAELPPLPVIDPTRLTAVVLAGNRGTENADFLAPFSLLSASNAFNVYVVAPERKLSPVTPIPPISSGVDIIPNFSFAEFDRTFTIAPDLIVIPFLTNIESAEDAPIIEWIRTHTGPHTIVLSICAGADILAETGLLDGRQATTHHNYISRSMKLYPAVAWQRNLRYVEDGNFVSSGGITAGVDATLYVIKRVVGDDAAREVARQVNYPHIRFLDAPAYTSPGANNAPLWLNIAYGRDKEAIGVYLYEGVDELAMTSVFDTYPFPAVAQTLTVAPERKIIRSKHGLYLVPRYDFETAPIFDRLLVPGSDLSVGSAATLEQWAQARHRASVEYPHRDQAGRYVFDVTLPDMAARYGQGVVKVVADRLNYPIETLRLGGSGRPIDMVVRPLALGLAGLGLAFWWQRRRPVLR